MLVGYGAKTSVTLTPEIQAMLDETALEVVRDRLHVERVRMPVVT